MGGIWFKPITSHLGYKKIFNQYLNDIDLVSGLQTGFNQYLLGKDTSKNLVAVELCTFKGIPKGLPSNEILAKI